MVSGHLRLTFAIGLSEFDRMFSRMQLELVELQQERSRLLAQKLNLMEELRGLKETHDEERKKLQKKMSDMEAKLDGKHFFPPFVPG